MSDPIRTHPEIAVQGVQSKRPGWLDFATSSDHKDVGRIFIGAALGFLALGVVEFFLMRLQLMLPDNTLIAPVTFNRLLSVFGVTMTSLFALPLAMGLITYLLPLQLGARTLAFPRLSTVALWLFLSGGAMTYVSFFYTPPEAGPIALPPLSGDLAFIDNNGTDVWIAAVGLSTLGLVLQAINVIVTASRERAPGMAWRRFPVFSFSGVVTSWLLLIVGPAMIAGLTMLIIDRHYGGVFFNAGESGSPTYFEHLSSIFTTGVYLIVLITAIGVITEIFQTFAGRPLANRRAVLRSLVAIAVLGTLAWMQNMMSAEIRPGFLYAAMAFALALIVPIGVVIWSWFGVLAGGSIKMRAPVVYAIGAVSLLSIGLAGEMMQSLIPVNWLLAGTTDSTAGTGLVLIGGSVMAGFAALHYWLPKMTGREVGEGAGKVVAVVIYLSTIVIAACFYLAGLEGQPADTYRFFEGQGLDTYNLIASIASIFLMLGVLGGLTNLTLGVNHGRRVGHDPWGGSTLEWFALSPPPPHNFDLVPDVRSSEPMHDIRRGVAGDSAETAEAVESPEPVA
jgi:cytochrome c oxidase subunit I+III